MWSEKRGETKDETFSRYGLSLQSGGRVINGPKRPEFYGKTPEFKYGDSVDIFCDGEKAFLKKKMLQTFSVSENIGLVLSIVNKVVTEIVGRSFRDFANIVVMAREDFEKFKRMIVKPEGVSDDFVAMNFGGLIIAEDGGGNNCFATLFHEIGHSFYLWEKDNYLNEFRAMYFQVLCTKKLEEALSQLGIWVSYDDISDSQPMPTKDHQKAFADAKLLYTYQAFYSEVVEGSPRCERAEEEMLVKVKQSRRSFKT